MGLIITMLAGYCYAADTKAKRIRTDDSADHFTSTNVEDTLAEVADGAVKFNTTQFMNAAQLYANTPVVPSTQTDTSSKGQLSYDEDYYYVAVAADTWRRKKWDPWDAALLLEDRGYLLLETGRYLLLE